MFRDFMQKRIKIFPLLRAAILGLILLIPLIALELVNRWKFNEDFPWAVFNFTWVLQTVFILLLVPIIKQRRSGKSLREDTIPFLLRIAGLVFIVYIWVGWILDQWPCLMGIPHCD
mgnify:CR=1 FL=1